MAIIPYIRAAVRALTVVAVGWVQVAEGGLPDSTVGGQWPEPGDTVSYEPGVAPSVLVLDSFDQVVPSLQNRYAHWREYQEGFDVYYVDAVCHLSRVPVTSHDPANRALRLKFRLPPALAWGNWLSIRRELGSPVDLGRFHGLDLSVKVDSTSTEVLLRVTLADVEKPDRPDELWWFDADRHLLENRTKGWVNVRMPFAAFCLSQGEGTRHNDLRLDLSRITAYEISVVSGPGVDTQGVLMLDSLRTYK